MRDKQWYENELEECERDVDSYTGILRRQKKKKKPDAEKIQIAKTLLETAREARRTCKQIIKTAAKSARKSAV